MSKIESLIRPDRDYTINPDYPLYPEQEIIVDFIFHNLNCIVSAQTGIGKTYSSLTAASHIQEYSDEAVAIIFCPKQAVKVFKKEIEEKICMPYSIYSADEVSLSKDHRFYIITHSYINKEESQKIVRWLNKNRKTIAIVDEAHHLQSHETQFTQTMRLFRDNFSCVWLLTATPLLNHMEGLFNIVDYCRPGYFGNFFRFRNKYLKTRKRKIRRGGRLVTFREVLGYKKLPELKQKLAEISIRVFRDYDLSFEFLSTPITAKEEDIYRIAAEGILDEDYDSENTKDFAPRLHDLQRVVDNSHSEMNTIPLSSKEELLISTVKEIINRGEASLIYVEYRSTEQRLSELLSNHKDEIGYFNLYFITGDTPFKERLEIEDDLDRQDIVILTSAGGQSINLEQANNIVFYDISFAIGNTIQVIGRITRANTDYDNFNIYFIEAENTIDTYKIKLMEDNAHLIQSVFEGGDPNLPDDVEKLNRESISEIRKKLLWRFE